MPVEARGAGREVRPARRSPRRCSSGNSSMKRLGIVEDHRPWMRRLTAKESLARLRARVRPTWARRRSSSSPARPLSSSARWLGNRPSSQPGRNTVSNSRPLAACSVISETRSGPLLLVRLHHERDVLEEGGEVRELLHGAHELLEVLEPPGGVGRLLLLPHLGVAGFLQDGLGQLVMRLASPPAARQRSKSSPRGRAAPSGRGLQLVGLDEVAGGLQQRHRAARGHGRAAPAGWRRRGPASAC